MRFASLLLISALTPLAPLFADAEQDTRLQTILPSTQTKVEEARRLTESLTALANQGHAHAAFLVSCCHEYGIGVPQDNEQSFRWMLKAAELGSGRAMLLAGEMAPINRRPAIRYPMDNPIALRDRFNFRQSFVDKNIKDIPIQDRKRLIHYAATCGNPAAQYSAFVDKFENDPTEYPERIKKLKASATKSDWITRAYLAKYDQLPVTDSIAALREAAAISSRFKLDLAHKLKDHPELGRSPTESFRLLEEIAGSPNAHAGLATLFIASRYADPKEPYFNPLKAERLLMPLFEQDNQIAEDRLVLLYRQNPGLPESESKLKAIHDRQIRICEKLAAMGDETSIMWLVGHHIHRLATGVKPEISRAFLREKARTDIRIANIYAQLITRGETPTAEALIEAAELLRTILATIPKKPQNQIQYRIACTNLAQVYGKMPDSPENKTAAAHWQKMADENFQPTQPR